jgi:NAD(P)-dependent dehydrogenase (short-subunit alcohol dehydrogenase family)
VKTAVVTGAGRGLGRLIAQGLADKGMAVLATDIDEEAARETAALIGGDAWHARHDVRDADSHRQLAAQATARGPLAVWVNNAGVLRTGLTWEIDDDEVRRHVDVNVLGVIYGARAAIAEMAVTGGHIINIASMSSLVPAPGLAVYGATKHAVLGFTTSLAGDLQSANMPIQVSAVCPDAIDTDMVREVADDEQSALLFSAGHLLTPEKVAAAVVELVDRPRLVVTLPAHRAALAHAVRPFPALGLRILGQFRKLGERHRRQRAR